MSVTHEPDCIDTEPRDDGRCSDWCYGCERCEPLRPGDYHVCAECLHDFRTPDELIDAHRAAGGGSESADEIASCPICDHDF